MEKCCYALVLLLIISSAAKTQWTGTPLNGRPICTAEGDQQTEVAISDGAGGAIIFWNDFRSFNRSVRYNKVSNTGALIWSTQNLGVVLFESPDYLRLEGAIEDGNGGAFVLIDAEGLYLQHISNTGSKLISGLGVLVSTTSEEGHLCLDNSGGVVVAWSDTKETQAVGIPRGFVQRFSSTGTPVWSPASGIKILNNNAANDFDTPVGIVRDASNNFLIGMVDTRNSNYEQINDEFDNIDIYAQKLDINGNKLWGAGGKPVCTSNSNQIAYRNQPSQVLVGDGNGGLIMAWEDYRNDPGNGNGSTDNSDIFIQRLNANGDAQWAANGIGACTADGYQGYFGMMPTSGGGALLWWYDERAGNDRWYAQSFSQAGSPLFATNGKIILNQNSYQITYTNDLQALLIVYINSGNIFFQRLNTGTLNSTLTMAAPIANSSDFEGDPALVDNGSGGAIVAYTRSINNVAQGDNIYATNVGSDGVLPVALVEFTAVWNSGDARLNWNTVQEANSSHFIAERSTDGATFSAIGKIAAAGVSNASRNYIFTDRISKQGFAGGTHLYYRLQIVDKDGTKAYSGVKLLSIPLTNAIVKIMGNPVKTDLQVFIQSSKKQKATLQVYDAVGKLIAINNTNLVEGENRVLLNAGAWANGLYFVTVTLANEKQALQFVK